MLAWLLLGASAWMVTDAFGEEPAGGIAAPNEVLGLPSDDLVDVIDVSLAPSAPFGSPDFALLAAARTQVGASPSFLDGDTRYRVKMLRPAISNAVLLTLAQNLTLRESALADCGCGDGGMTTQVALTEQVSQALVQNIEGAYRDRIRSTEANDLLAVGFSRALFPRMDPDDPLDRGRVALAYYGTAAGISAALLAAGMQSDLSATGDLFRVGDGARVFWLAGAKQVALAGNPAFQGGMIARGPNWEARLVAYETASPEDGTPPMIEVYLRDSEVAEILPAAGAWKLSPSVTVRYIFESESSPSTTRTDLGIGIVGPRPSEESHPAWGARVAVSSDWDTEHALTTQFRLQNRAETAFAAMDLAWVPNAEGTEDDEPLTLSFLLGFKK